MRLALCWPPCTRSVTTVRPGAPAPAALAGRLLPQGAPAAHAHGSAGRRTGAGLTSKTPTNARIAVVAGFLPGCGAARVHPAARCGPGDPWWQPWALRQDTGFLSDPRRTALDQEAPLGRLREGAGAGWAGQLASTQHICRCPGVTREAAVGTRRLLAPRHPPGTLAPPPSTSHCAEAQGPSRHAADGAQALGTGPGPTPGSLRPRKGRALPPLAGAADDRGPGPGPRDLVSHAESHCAACGGLPGCHRRTQCPGSPPGVRHGSCGRLGPARPSGTGQPHGAGLGKRLLTRAFSHLPT